MPGDKRSGKVIEAQVIKDTTPDCPRIDKKSRADLGAVQY